jgi:hypothetical protein
MTLSHLPAFLTNAFLDLAHWLDKRSAARVPVLLLGILFASGRRTVTSWFRAAGIRAEFRPAYVTVCAIGREAESMATTPLLVVKPLLGSKRLRVAIDDTPTARYGPEVEGAGIHHNPTPGPAGEKHVYGHVWVTLAALARHEDWGTIALPLQAQLYIRQIDLPKLPAERRRAFRTKLEMAVEQLRWLWPWVHRDFSELWVVVDGAYAKRPFLRGAQATGFTVISRLRKDAALCSVPKPPKPGQRRGPGRPPTYGKQRICLAKRAGQPRGWQTVQCVQYGEVVTKTIKTFLATYKPVGGLIRVVIVQEEDDWLPYFSMDPNVTAVEILEAMADRSSEENTFKDEKEIWGAGQQQVRNVYSNEACFNLNLWMYTLVEAWAWDKDDEEVCDRSASPWDKQPRRPSHNDKRKALQREVLRGEIEEVLSGRPSKQEIRAMMERLLDMAT